MRRVKRLKEAIARLERESAATEAQLDEEFEHGYAAGYNAACAEVDALISAHPVQIRPAYETDGSVYDEPPGEPG